MLHGAKTFCIFTRPNEDKIIDFIPLSEVTSLSPTHTAESMKPNAENMSKDIEKRSSSLSFLHNTKSVLSAVRGSTVPIADLDRTNEIEDSDAHEAARAMDFNLSMNGKIVQIKTIPHGFNSGRVYYLRSNYPGFSSSFCSEMMRKAKDARVRSEKLSRFQKNQATLRKIYHSTLFQLVVSCLILAVRVDIEFCTRITSLAGSFPELRGHCCAVRAQWEHCKP